MSPNAEVLGHRIVLDGTIGEVLYRLREVRGQSQAAQCQRLRVSHYDYRRLAGRRIPPPATFAADVIAIAHDCNVGAPQLLLKLLREGMALTGSSDDEASREVGG